MGLSKQNAYNLMTSADFDNMPEKESIEALENLNYDWKTNAVKKAQTYSDAYHLSAKEISEILKINENSIRSKMSRAKAKLKKQIEGEMV